MSYKSTRARPADACRHPALFLAIACLLLSACANPAEQSLASAKAITAFYFLGYENYHGTIDEPTGAISVVLPFAAARTSLIAVFTCTGTSVTVEGVEQIAGVTANDFASSVTYRVTAEDGSGRNYAVTVANAPYQFLAQVTTLAGKPRYVDGTGSAARFYDPHGIATDGANLYVADSGNHTVRQVVIATGAVTTLAGKPGQVGDDIGPGSTARFAGPGGIAVSEGYGYVADTGNCSIRRIALTTGWVTNLAGVSGSSGSTDGLGNAARFCYPSGIATDGVYLYVADTNNDTIRKIEIATRTVTTVAGSPSSNGTADGMGASARFFHPEGIAVSGASLFVSDTMNHSIRRIVIATGAVTTLAGSPGSEGSADGFGSTARFCYPGGIVAVGGDLYVADRWNHAVRKINVETGEVTTIAGSLGSSGSTDGIGISARFNGPTGIVTDGSHLFLTEVGNDTVRALDVGTGSVTTIAGSAPGSDGAGSAARFDFPSGIATDGTSLYIADTNGDTIRRIAIATGDVATIAGVSGSAGSADGTGSAARFSSPWGIAISGADLYVADMDNHAIRRVEIVTGVVSTVAGAAGSSGNSDGTGGAARFNKPSGIAAQGDYLFVADAENHTIRRIAIATGEVSTLAGVPGSYGRTDGIGSSARFDNPYGIAALGPDLYVADRDNHAIRRIAIDTAEVTTFAGSSISGGYDDGAGGSARFIYPVGIATNGIDLFVTDTNIMAIRRVIVAEAIVTTFAGSPLFSGFVDGVGSEARFDSPCGIATDGTNLYVADSYNDAIRAIR